MTIRSTVIVTPNSLPDANELESGRWEWTIVWLTTIPDGGPQGGYFRDRKPIDW